MKDSEVSIQNPESRIQKPSSLQALDALPGVAAHFFGRIPGLDVVLERREAMDLLAPHHQDLRRKAGLGDYPFVTAEQIHGCGIALVGQQNASAPAPISGVYGLMTSERGITLGIYFADCAPVWIVAKNGTAGALLHSGKMGTELGIVAKGIEMLCKEFRLTPQELIVAIGPCIRPPCYDVDFAAIIRLQARASGVIEILDDLSCTACHPDHSYSYRRERGLTGRMLATLTLTPAN